MRDVIDQVTDNITALFRVCRIFNLCRNCLWFSSKATGKFVLTILFAVYKGTRGHHTTVERPVLHDLCAILVSTLD
jgi:hypothetical protein